MTTTNETAGNTFMRRVKGAKDLKEYIEWMTKMTGDVAREFQHDLKQEKAVVRRNRICRGGPDFSAEMCEIAHNDFVYQMTQLPQSSEYLQTTDILLGSIQQLESIRKMLVNNKQQKKTTIRRIRNIINVARSSAAAAAAAAALTHDECGEVMMVELEHPATEDCQTVKELYGLIEMTKQNHRTISKQLIENQVWPIMCALRTRHVLAFKLAAENTIGEIIHHAEKCRAFMLRCRWLALVEYGASSWWLETQKDPMDHSYYHVSAVIVGEEEEEEDEFKKFNPKKQYPAFLDQLMNANIRIVVTGDDSRFRVAAYDLTRELSETILTEDAINAFENTQNDLLIRQLQQQPQQEQDQ
jgi:hypothetical protein